MSLPREWQGPKDLNYHLIPPSIHISRKLGFGELSLNTETWDGGIPNGNLNTAKYELLECRLEDMILQLDHS